MVLLTNFGLICFSKTKFNVEEFIPLVGSRLELSSSSNKKMTVYLPDDSKKILEFYSSIERKMWYDSMEKMIELLDNHN